MPGNSRTTRFALRPGSLFWSCGPAPHHERERVADAHAPLAWIRGGRPLWAFALLLPCILAAQDPVLHVTVLSGDGAIYAPGAHAAKPLTIAVTDGAGRPVEGARISFQLPGDGPGGTFASGLRTDLAVSDSAGRALVRALQLNHVPGEFHLKITAAKDQARAGIMVKEFIAEPKGAVENTKQQSPPKAGAEAPAIPESAQTSPRTTNPGRTADSAAIAVASPSPAPAKTAEQGATTPSRLQTIIITGKTPKPDWERGASAGHKSHKKWVVLGAILAGGAAGAFAGTSLGSSAAAHGAIGALNAGSAVSIGSPTISIGKP